MRRLKVIALEEKLEVEKLHDRELAARKGGEYDLQFNDLQEKAKVAEAAEEEDPDGSLDTPVEGEDSAPPEDNAEVDTEADPEETAAMESIRELHYSPEVFSAAVYTLADLITLLGVLGIQFGAAIASHVFKGVVYLFAKAARMWYTSGKMLVKYIERRVNSFNNLKTDISKLRESLKQINEKEEQTDLEGSKFTNRQSINLLKIGESVDFTENINLLTSSVESTVGKLTDQITHEILAINHIMTAGKSGYGKLPANIMVIRPETIGMAEGLVPGYTPASEYVKAYRSSNNFPGDVSLIGMFPNKDLTELADMTRGYNDSALVLGFDTSSFTEVEAVDYMNSDALGSFLDALEKLCDTCIAHQAKYDKVKENKLYLKSYYKNYFTALVHKDKKVSVADSFMEQIYLKSMFVDKVYLTSMIDIHDYASKVLVTGTRYVKANIDRLA